MNRFCVAWLLAFYLAGAASAAQITVTARAVPAAPTIGQTFQVEVDLHLPEPWHANANPASAPELVATELTFDANPAAIIGAVRYPKGKETKVSWNDTPVALYAGTVTFTASAKLTAPTTIHGTLRYQACDDHLCYAPKNVPFEIALGATAPASVATPPAPAEPPNRLTTMIHERGLVLAMVSVFLLGLALNLTPCVFPMITITVSYFGATADSGRTRQQAFAGAAFYCLGIVASYTALGVFAAFTGGMFGAALQSQWVLVGIAGLLVALALSMFGLYEIRPPSFLVQRAAGLSGRAGYLGVFLLGATLGIIAAPCIAPIAVALLTYVAATRQWWWFAIFSAGLAAPYLVLGTYSSLLTRLPKSGTWMVNVKRIFGTALIAAAVWLLWPMIGPKSSAPSPIAWQAYAPALTVNPGQPVVIDFYADWCIPCHELDKTTFRDAAVVAATKDFRMLKADLTNEDSPLYRQFNIRGVPTIVFLDATGAEHVELRQIGYLNAKEFLEKLAQARQPATTNAPALTESIPPALLPKF